MRILRSARGVRGTGVEEKAQSAFRRERVTYYAAATLIEFGSCSERDQALESWPGGDGEAPTAVAERFLLVDNERTIPFDRFRLTGARDYRRPPEVCVTIESDGVSMALDPARSDLLVDAELNRFADGSAAPPCWTVRESEPRRFVVTTATLRRERAGASTRTCSPMAPGRTGGEVPPPSDSAGAAGARTALKATRSGPPSLPSAFDLRRHDPASATRPWLGDRLESDRRGDSRRPPAIASEALKELGIILDAE
jgi:hypothetical protein